MKVDPTVQNQVNTKSYYRKDFTVSDCYAVCYALRFDYLTIVVSYLICKYTTGVYPCWETDAV